MNAKRTNLLLLLFEIGETYIISTHTLSYYPCLGTSDAKGDEVVVGTSVCG